MTNGEKHYDSAFRDTVIAGLSEVKTQNAMIIARLEKINGSVTMLFQKTNILDVNLTAHPLTCPTRDKVEELARAVESGDHPGSTRMNERIQKLEMTVEDQRAGSRAAESTSKRWVQILMPLLYLVAGGILFLFALHSNELMKASIVKLP